MHRFPLLRLAALGLLATLFAVASCSDSTGPPPVGTIALQGAAIAGQAGSTVTVQVRVDDESGSPIEGVEVRFQASSGTTTPSVTETGAGGLAQTAWTLGTTAGPQALQVSAGSRSITVNAQAEAGAPADIEIVDGDGQTGQVGQALATPLAVRVTDEFGNPTAGVTVSFSTAAAGSSANPASATTDGDGRASSTWTLGERAGSQTLQAQAGGAGSATFTATADPGPPAQIVVVSGDDQTGQVAQPLPNLLEAEVQDEFGNELEGVTVEFQPGEGSGSVAPTSRDSDEDGRVETAWTLGETAGEQTVAATSGELEPAVFNATAEAAAPDTLVKVSGDGQEGFTGFALAEDIVVEIRDEFGNPVPEIQVGFNVTAGGGTANPVTAATGEDGRASTTWTLGPALGDQTLVAGAAGLTAAEFTATASEFVGQVEIVRGDAQTTAAGTPVPIPPRVRVVDGLGNPVPGVDVAFQVTGGGGAVQGSDKVTNADGIATADEWVLGAGAGENTLEVTGAGITGITFTATGTALAEPYNIEVRFVTEPTEARRQAFVDAVARWEAAIIEGLPEMAVSRAANTCGNGDVPHPAIDETVDDIVIFAQFDSIDGPNQILARAGPCNVRTGTRLASLGVMQFDTADIQDTEDAGLLDEVVEHEMGHVLGFLPFTWDATGLILDEGSASVRFVGAAAIARFEAAGGTPQGAVPLEGDQGSQGTLDAHWDEAVMDTELMTGFTDDVMPRSAITIGAFHDMGYTVDLSAAAPYEVPSGGALRAGEGFRGIHLKEEIILPPGW